jgi:hypothetical protein
MVKGSIESSAQLGQVEIPWVMFPKFENSPLQPVELVVEEDYRHHSDAAALSTTRREYHSLNTGKTHGGSGAQSRPRGWMGGY